MDALTVSLVGITVKEVLDGVKAAYRRYRTANTETAASDLQETYELAIRLWGSLLFESRANVERLRYMSEGAKKSPPYYSFAPFDFGVSDALLPEFCRVVPTPAILESCRLIVAAAKRVDFFQRVAAAAQREEAETALRAKAGAFASDAIDKGVVRRYNALVEKANAVAGAVFLSGDDNGPLIERMLPAQIDPSAPVDHSLF